MFTLGCRPKHDALAQRLEGIWPNALVSRVRASDDGVQADAAMATRRMRVFITPS